MNIVPALLLLLLIAASAPAKELARWEAALPAPRENGIRLEGGPEWRIEGPASSASARIIPSRDYYTRSAYRLRIDSPPAHGAWVVIGFLDRGHGLIAVSPAVPETRQWGVARVNSGRERTAVIRYDKGVPPALRIEGLDWLRSVVITTEEPRLDPAPLVEPAAKFAVHSERVSSVPGDATSRDRVGDALAGIRNQAPLLRALGFNGVETYVRWGYVEHRRGVYDWSFYDAILDEIEKHGLQWFPMLLAGSGYALPAWLHGSNESYGFRCLEHGIVHDTQSIFHPFQATYARRFIAEFGRHYGNRKSLLGIRLGPSGDYGEAQYPARGPGYGFRQSHTHIGYWAGDEMARASFRESVRSRYGGDLAKLNEAWGQRFPSFDAVQTFLPETAATRRMRIDFADWYMGAMSDWCEKWAVWARESLPDAQIHQSSGGWGPVPIGTDYSFQARSMARIKGGIRLTNESDDYADNFTITRMASSAARFYGAHLGYEPGGYGSKRGVMARLYNTVTNGAVHLFYYISNLASNDQAIDAWLRHSALLDQRARPVIEVAAFYPDTAIKLDDEVLRYRWASTFFTVGRALREELDFDYASEQMIGDGALARFKVLVFLWGAVTEKTVLERIDRWVREGGAVIFAPRPRGVPSTVEGDSSIAQRWMSGDTGKGRAIVWNGDLIPSRHFAEFIRDTLRAMPSINPRIRSALSMEKPSAVYWSVLENGGLALLNFDGRPASVRLQDGRTVTIGPYEPLLLR